MVDRCVSLLQRSSDDAPDGIAFLTAEFRIRSARMADEVDAIAKHQAARKHCLCVQPLSTQLTMA